MNTPWGETMKNPTQSEMFGEAEGAKALAGEK
jgi:hypothetical protein